MTEEQLNENLIKLELQGICQDCIYLDKIVPIIRKMLSEEYKTGLEQSRFDKNMLERENQELKKQLDELQAVYNNMFKCHCNRVQVETLLSQQKEFIEWLEQSAKKYTSNVRVNVFDEYGNRIAQYINAKVYEITPEDVVKEVLSKYKEIIGVKDE